MATGYAAKKSTRPEAPEGPRPYRLTLEQYMTMIKAGVFPEDARIELLGGELVEQMTKYPPHSFGVDASAAILRAILPKGWTVREKKPIDLDERSCPEPDVVVAKGSREDYRHRNPSAREVALIIEVAESSYAEDRGRKWTLYAAAKVPAYAILNIAARRFEFYSKPYGRAENARYRESQTFDEASEMPIVIEGKEHVRIAVRDVLA